jgi:undecaprenyl pyrophosphate synthase
MKWGKNFHKVKRLLQFNEKRYSHFIWQLQEGKVSVETSLTEPIVYSRQVIFIDLGWWEFDASHLELAIDDFNRRHRRFGGLDS